MKRLTLTAAIVGLTVAMFGIAGPASASTGDADVDPQIAAVMAEVPGGVLVDSHHAVWPGIDMELVVPDSSGVAARSAVGSCANGQVCVYTGSSLGGSILSWGTCGYHAIPSSFTAKSVADARGSGSAQARSGSTVVATAPAGGWANIYGAVNNVLCYF